MKKFIIGAIVGILICGITTSAIEKFKANEVTYKETTVENALDELYVKSERTNIKSGELFLKLYMKAGIEVSHNNYSGYTASAYLRNLDFSDIKSFTYEFTINTNYLSAQFFEFSNADGIIENVTSTKTGKIDINGKKDVIFSLQTSFGGTNTFKINSYETMDGIVYQN